MLARHTTAALLAAAALALAACGEDDEPETTAQTTTEQATTEAEATTTEQEANRPAESTVAAGLEAPWDLAFLPNGEALITERGGAVRRLNKNLELASAPVGTVDRVLATGESGLLGIAIDPDYESNNFVYMYRTTSDGNEVARFTYEDGNLSENAVILEGLQAGAIHDGGRIRFGPDDALYVTTGEAGQPELAQDPDSLNGKILKIDDPASATGDGLPDVISSGHRNVQGLDWQPGSDQLYVSEFGPDANDEINKIEQAKNYGWPTAQGDDDGGGEFEPALVDYESVIAPSGATFVHNEGSAWTGDFLVAALRGEQLRRVTISENGEVENDETLYEGEYGRLRQVVEGPDGAIYLITNNTDGRGSPRDGDDRIVRLEPPNS